MKDEVLLEVLCERVNYALGREVNPWGEPSVARTMAGQIFDRPMQEKDCLGCWPLLFDAVAAAEVAPARQGWALDGHADPDYGANPSYREFCWTRDPILIAERWHGDVPGWWDE